MNVAELELSDWRRGVAEMYVAVRAEPDPCQAHRYWRDERDRLFATHPQSPLVEADPLRSSGIPYWPYDESLRFELAVEPTPPQRLNVVTDDTATSLLRVGLVRLPAPVSEGLDVWWMDQYGGGLFLPVRDGTAGSTSYGGGRYCLDTAKGSDLGGDFTSLVVDLNFLYHPSCRYNPRWVCPLATEGNTIASEIRAGECL